MQLNDGRLVTWLRGRNALLWAKDFDKNDQLVFTPCYEMDDRNLHDSTVQVIQLRSGKLASENYNNTIYIWTVRKLKTIQKYKPGFMVSDAMAVIDDKLIISEQARGATLAAGREHELVLRDVRHGQRRQD